MNLKNPHKDRRLEETLLNNPRLAFSDVTSRVFPLPASINRLQNFCDNYLNFMDDEVCDRPRHYFKPAMPWVYLEVVNYGQMATATRNRGWVAQHEVFFLVPLEWYVIEKGQLVFKDWAMVTPFIFVDNDISMTTGREVYGWVKVRAWLDHLDPNWADDAATPRQLLNLQTKLFPRVYSGEAVEQRTLIQITKDPSPSLLRRICSENDIFGPLWSIPEAMRNSITLFEDMAQFVGGLPLRGYSPRSVIARGEMLSKAVLNVNRFLPWWQLDRDTVRNADKRAHAHGDDYYLNQITLKQFRDAAEPDYACFQGLVNSRIAIDHYYDGGLLGPTRVSMGDLSGGIKIRLHDYPEQQIQSTLGLDVACWERTSDGGRVAQLIPQLPFWATFDLSYDGGDTLCWRTKTSDWHHRAGCCDVPEFIEGNAFNSTRGAAIQESYGPYEYPDVTIRVFPLRADKRALEHYCDEYVNRHGDEPADPGELCTVDGHRFEPWGSYVYMAIFTQSNEESTAFSVGNNLGAITEEQIVFYLPVKWYKRDDRFGPLTDRNKDQSLYKLAVLTPFVFGSSRRVVSEREVNGTPARHGSIVGGPDVWLNTFRGKERSILAELSTLLITEFDIGQPAREEKLVEVVDVPEPVLASLEMQFRKPDGALKRIMYFLHYVVLRFASRVERFFAVLLRFFGIDIRPAFLDFLARVPFNHVALKKIRATAKEGGKRTDYPESYEALVMVGKTIERLFTGTYWAEKAEWNYQYFAERINKDIRLDIHYYEGLDVAGILGLQDGQFITREGKVPIQEFRPEDPFRIRLHAKEDLGCNVAVRNPCEPWREDLMVDEDIEKVCSCRLERPSWLERIELEYFARKDGPQGLIRNYLRVFAKIGHDY